MNSLWDIHIFLGLVPKESPCRSCLNYTRKKKMCNHLANFETDFRLRVWIYSSFVCIYNCTIPQIPLLFKKKSSEITLPFRKRHALSYNPEGLIFILGPIRSVRSIVSLISYLIYSMMMKDQVSLKRLYTSANTACDTSPCVKAVEISNLKSLGFI